MIESVSTPCRASKENDVMTRLELLKNVEGYPTGLEVVGPISDFTSPIQRAAMKKNLAAARKAGLSQITIHSPIEREDFNSPRADLSEPEGLRLLQAVFDLANEVKAKVVTVHCGLLHNIWEIEALTDQGRERLKKTVATNINGLQRGSVLLGIENMPWPLFGDIFYSKADMVFDPLFADPVELYEFVKENYLHMTFDTCHWGALGVSLSLADIFRKIEERVAVIHLSDIYGKWLPGTAVFQEGLIPGQGNLGKENFRKLVSYLKTSKKPVVLNLEVNDQDFSNPKESQETIGLVLNWLR